MIPDRDWITKVMFLRRQDEIKSTAQVEGVAFARTMNNLSKGTGKKTEYVVSMQLYGQMWLWEFEKYLWIASILSVKRKQGDHLKVKIRD